MKPRTFNQQCANVYNINKYKLHKRDKLCSFMKISDKFVREIIDKNCKKPKKRGGYDKGLLVKK